MLWQKKVCINMRLNFNDSFTDLWKFDFRWSSVSLKNWKPQQKPNHQFDVIKTSFLPVVMIHVLSLSLISINSFCQFFMLVVDVFAFGFFISGYLASNMGIAKVHTPIYRPLLHRNPDFIFYLSHFFKLCLSYYYTFFASNIHSNHQMLVSCN